MAPDTNGSESLPSTKLGIICARYKEPLDVWTPLAAHVYLYSKGGPQDDAVPHSAFRSYLELPNTGREGQTYLQHIVRNYDSLEEVLIFTQADPFDLIGADVKTTEHMVRMALQVAPGAVTPFDEDLYHILADWDRIDWEDPAQRVWITPAQIKSLTPAPYTAGQFWEIVVGHAPPPAIRAMHGGIFAVRRETIRKQPKCLYERALAEFEKANAVNPEIGFFMERMWAPLFSDTHVLDAPPPRADLHLIPRSDTLAVIQRFRGREHF